MDLWNLGKEPVSTDHPEGSDIRYDPDFEQLQAEMDKLSSPSAAGGVDWTRVVDTASRLLADKSKDLMVASSLAVALLVTRQAEGLAIGLRIYRDLLTHFWETLYPPKKRLRGRVRTIEWWIERNQALLPSLDTSGLPPTLIQGMKEDFQAIDGLLGEYLEEAPSTGPLRDFLDSIVLDIEEEASPEPPAETPTEATAGAAEGRSYEAEPQPLPMTREETEKPAPAGRDERAPTVLPREERGIEPLAEITTAREAQRELTGCLQRIRKVAAALWQEEISGPLSYRLNRIASWMQVVELPPALDGRTRVPPPDGQSRMVLSGLMEKGDWENLLKSAEPRIPQSLFWLDLNRYVAAALGGLGERCQAARRMVCDETAFFVYRLPGLENLAFSDGTPFADGATRKWLQESPLFLNQGSMPVSSPAVQGDDFMESELARARKLAGEGNLPAALEILQKGVRTGSSSRERFSWRLALSGLLVRSRNTDLLMPHLEQILADLDNYRLELWDPVLAVNALRVVWTGLMLLPEGSGRERAGEVFGRIAGLDVVQAMLLEK
jgi:type VI secretion system protein VasJ